jgi:hypothetical protein
VKNKKHISLMMIFKEKVRIIPREKKKYKTCEMKCHIAPQIISWYDM